MRTPDDERTQPLEILTPADTVCAQWMQHGKQLAERRKQKEQSR